MADKVGQGVYIEETWTPHYILKPLPAYAISALGNLTRSLDDLAIIAPTSSDFSAMDSEWLKFIAKFAAANGMESVTPFLTQTFFALGAAGQPNLHFSRRVWQKAASSGINVFATTRFGQGGNGFRYDRV